jgi:glycogen debranching enzyme
MEDPANVSGDFYVLTTSGMADDRYRIVKQSDTFAIFDIYGDICRRSCGPQGLYCQGTRFLSHYALTLEGKDLLLLSSDVTRDNHLIVVDLANPDLIFASGLSIPKGMLHIFRSKFLWDGSCYEKCRVKNYGLLPVSFKLGFTFNADFIDIFEVRGIKRHRRGKYRSPKIVSGRVLELSYEGLDDILRRTRIDFSRAPDLFETNRADYNISLGVDEKIELEVTVSCVSGETDSRPKTSYVRAYSESSENLRIAGRRESSIFTSNEYFNTLIERATSDLRMLLTDEEGILYPYAGIPWFSTPFGRDGLITALETLWFNPDIGRDVLAFLSERQSDSFSDIQDAEPGKILHEIRTGEMTNCGDLPFSRYYGSVDSTPLFVLLAGKYFRRTGDRPFIMKLWPHVERALTWMNQFGDLDGDGFVEYRRRSEHGIQNQGWKDSHDSIFHQDGVLAEAPIAACEIQGYVYAAKKEAAFMAESLGNNETAKKLNAEAEQLQKRFEASFWDDEMGGYVLALDAQKKACRVKGSNMGHCLYAGIASLARAGRTVELLMGSDFFSGWGIRTLAKGQRRYNPMSYHNGSIWPHDNALIAEGFSHYGFNRYAAAIMDALFQMSKYTELNRFPELFCGFDKREDQGPTLYPVACSPQAWSAATPFLLLKSCLGLRIDAAAKRISLNTPYLPASLETVRIQNLEVGGTKVDFMVRRHKNDVSLQVFERTEDIRFFIER